MTQISDAQRRMEQFQCMMTEIVRNALKDNNMDLGEEIGTEFSDRVLKEMNYLHRCQEEQEEERFKKVWYEIFSSLHNFIKRAAEYPSVVYFCPP